MAKSSWGRIEGLRECREALQSLDRRVQTNVGKRALGAPADVFVAAIKQKAPVSDRPSNPTPASLRDSIVKTKPSSRRGRAEMAILAEDIAAVPNEYGTSKMAPQPFFRPAVDANRLPAAQAMASAVQRETDAAAQRAKGRNKQG